MASLLTFTSIRQQDKPVDTVECVATLLASIPQEVRHVYSNLLRATEGDNSTNKNYIIRMLDNENNVRVSTLTQSPVIVVDDVGTLLLVTDSEYLDNTECNGHTIIPLPKNQELLDALFIPNTKLLSRYISNYKRVGVLV